MIEENSEVINSQVEYSDPEWVMRNNVVSVCNITQNAMQQLNKTYNPVMQFVVYTFHLFNAQCVAENFVGEEARQEWFKMNEMATKLVEEGVNEIHRMRQNPTEEFQKILADGMQDQPIFILPEITPVAKGSNIIQ